jgi:low temperature requirement protein LtrA
MAGFWLPGLGRSATSDWTIDGGHLAERCQLFVIVALGESILATGAGFGGAAHPGVATWLALLVAFAGSIALWWIYFDTASEHGTHAIQHAADPGRVGANFHYVHVTLIAGIIVAAVADELMIHHPDQAVDPASAWAMVGGPLIYLLGNAAYRKVVYGWFPPSHLAGIALLLLAGPVALATDRLVAGTLTTVILIGVAAWQSTHAPARPGSRGRPLAG